MLLKRLVSVLFVLLLTAYPGPSTVAEPTLTNTSNVPAEKIC
jgi:hypothetical protein